MRGWREMSWLRRIVSIVSVATIVGWIVAALLGGPWEPILVTSLVFGAIEVGLGWRQWTTAPARRPEDPPEKPNAL